MLADASEKVRQLAAGVCVVPPSALALVMKFYFYCNISDAMQRNVSDVKKEVTRCNKIQSHTMQCNAMCVCRPAFGARAGGRVPLEDSERDFDRGGR